MAYYQYLVSVTTPSSSSSMRAQRSSSVDRYSSGYSSSYALDSRKDASSKTPNGYNRI